MKFKQGDAVVWDVEASSVPVGEGTVCGIASADLPIIGRGWIIELPTNATLHNYPFRCIVVHEALLSKK